MGMSEVHGLWVCNRKQKPALRLVYEKRTNPPINTKGKEQKNPAESRGDVLIQVGGNNEEK